MKNLILLYSGGMDSLIGWEWLDRPKTLYVDLGHKYREKELVAIQKTIPDTKIIENHVIGNYEKEDAEIPNRNLLLAMYAALEGADNIAVIVQKDEMSIPDRSDVFFDATSDLLSLLNNRRIEVFSPFASMDKTDMVEWFLHRDLPVQPLLDTVGCYSDEDGHCGDCPACLRRFIAFKNNDVDPGYILTERIKSIYRENLSSYSKDRQNAMRRWLKEVTT